MNSDKTNAVLLSAILKEKNVQNIVLCPGSRNAPLVISFTSDDYFNTYSIVDERSAAFFALGLAQSTKQTTCIICTSGSAVLNFAPAVAEAYYQRLPLLVISADRPHEWVNQGESQTLQQNEIYKNYVRKSYDLVQEPVDDTNFWFNKRQIALAIEETRHPYFGPVHINARFREPLYQTSSTPLQYEDSLRVLTTKTTIGEEQLEDLQQIWENCEKKMIICGQMFPDEKLNQVLNNLNQKGVVVLTETTSNLHGENFIPCIDKLIIPSSKSELESMNPDLLITVGGPLISRKIKNYLRQNKKLIHWHVDPIDHVNDAFQNQKAAIPMIASEFLSYFLENNIAENTFYSIWKKRKEKSETNHKEYFESAEYSDLSAIGKVLQNIPEKSFVQCGNSASIRYIQLFDNQGKFKSYCNRGTSGIEGSVSTAVGMSKINKSPTYLIVGDLSLKYDSNGLWNNYVNGNLKIVVINNGGGGIFRIIDGPDSVQKFEEYIETKDNSNFEKFADCYDLNYFLANSLIDIDRVWSEFSKESERASLLEINTKEVKNAEILKEYFKKLN